jgi:PPOX class probable F420-dependent enzyme
VVAAVSTLRELPSWASELIDQARVAHLGLLDDQRRPRVMPVTFAVVGGAVWSAIDDKPKDRPGEELARVRWLRARPQSALTVDRYDDDWTHLAWVQVIGATEVLELDGYEDVMAALRERYPQYRDTPPRGPLLRLGPNRVVYWSAAEGA